MLEKLKNPFTIIIAAIVTIVVVVMGVLLVKIEEKEKAASSNALSQESSGNLNPKIVQYDYDPKQLSVEGTTVKLGNPQAKTTLTTVGDYSCPGCKANEEQTRDAVEKYVKSGDVKVEYKMVSILDNTDKYSTRTANFMLAVAKTSPAQWGTLHNTLFENQPPHTTEPTGYTDKQLLGVAKEVGVKDTSAIAKAMKDETYFDQISTQTDTLIKQGLEGTPTVFLNGKEISYGSTGQFTALVDRAIG